MKILYILGAYKPNMSANGVCSDNVINKLLEEGHEVFALVNSAVGTQARTEDGNLTVVRVKQRLSMRLWQKSDSVSASKPKRARLLSLLAKALNKAKLIVTAPFWPIVSRATVLRFKKAAVKLYKEKNFDAAVSVYTPIESLLAGCHLKKRFPEIKFYPYFLDSLSGGYGPRFFSKEMTLRRGLKIEKRVFPYADRIIVMKSSEKHHEKYNSEFLEKMSFLDIPTFLKNKGDAVDKTEIKENAPIKFLYVGSISLAVRDPSGIIRVLSETAEENFTCELVGKIDCMQLFEPLKKKLGDRLIFSGQVSHSAAMKKISEADVLLNIGNRLSTMIPSKIFEYISYAKPIISTYETDDEPSIPYLKNYPLALLLDCRKKEGFGDAVFSFLKKIKTKHIDTERLSELYKLNSPEAFTELLGNNND